MRKNAEHLMKELRGSKADRVEIWPTTPGHPAVFASFMHAPGKPTLLVYGHHDVQPVEPLDEWVLAAVRARDPRRAHVGPRRRRRQGPGLHPREGDRVVPRRRAEKLPINLKLIVEGEEEIGSRPTSTRSCASTPPISRPTTCA